MTIEACDNYSRPAGVMGGPCLNCGRSQPEHVRAAQAELTELTDGSLRLARFATQLTDGSPVPTDRSHTELRPDGQQKGYVVLSPEERAKGFVKPVRRSYIHKKCGGVTWMGMALAETYARNPRFYSGTFCCGCRSHYGLDEFNWEPDGEPMDPHQQEAWAVEHAAKEAREKEERRQRRIAELRRELAELEADVTS